MVQVRAGHGFQYVRAVMLRSDFETVNVLYDFTEEALKTSGTGRLEDLENWYSGNYDERFRHLFTNPRPWCRPTFGSPAFKQVRIGNELLRPPVQEPQRKPSKQGM